MSNWLTEGEAAAYLKVPEKALKNARYRKKVKARKICGTVQYQQEWLDEFREGTCEEHQNLTNATGRRSGTSRSPQTADQNALARARAIVLKLNESSRSSSSSAGKRGH